jgi:two-component system, sensor histidine kinase and response regulator
MGLRLFFARSAASARHQGLSERMAAPVKCLIVDDLEENLLAMQALLREEGVEVLTARSGAEALELLLVHDVALAFLDVQMPGMDGFELAELMRGSERTRHVPLIFVTAGSRDQYRMFKGYDAGAVDFLFKPIEPHILKSKADVFFELHRSKQQLAQELRERTDMLRLSEMFTAVLGHDLRNPLNAIVTSAHLLQRQSKEDAVKQTAERILSSGKRMGRMIQDILDLARARLAGGIPLKRESVELGTLIDRVVREHHGAISGRHIDVRYLGDLHGEWDADRLTQVASNLISNAIRYGDASRAIEVRIDGTESDTVSFSVTNGGTISPDLLPHIFDPFRGSSNGSPRAEGLGLGLYIVQQLVDAHEGAVDVRSGAGDDRTTFTVTIPRR